MYGLGFFSFNIVGFSSPLLPCRLVDLRRGLIYSENLQHPPSLSSHSTAVEFGCLKVVNQMSYLTIGLLENTSRLVDVSLNWTINSTG